MRWPEANDEAWSKARDRLRDDLAWVWSEFPAPSYIYCLRPDNGHFAGILKVGSCGRLQVRQRPMAHLLTSPISLRLFEVFGVATDDPVPDERLIQSRLGCHHGEWCYFDASALREASAMLDRAGLAGQW